MPTLPGVCSPVCACTWPPLSKALILESLPLTFHPRSNGYKGKSKCTQKKKINVDPTVLTWESPILLWLFVSLAPSTVPDTEKVLNKWLLN